MTKKTEIFLEALGDLLDKFDDGSFQARIRKVLTPIHNCNTNEKAFEIRNLLEDPEIENHPVLCSLEATWQLLSDHYGDFNGKPLLSRVELPDRTAESPLENFELHVDLGFYPPPEVMMVIQLCFHKYLAMGGEISLDEAFFGKPYQKRESYAYLIKRKWKYRMFHKYQADSHRKHLNEPDQPKLSLENLAVDHLARLFPNRDDDIDTFLRGYRRWKREHGIED